MFDIPEDYEPLGFRLRVPIKKKARALLRRTKEELEKFLISNGVKAIMEKDGEFQFLGTDDELCEPSNFFGKLRAKINRQRDANTERVREFVGHSGGGYIPFPRNSTVERTRPIDKGLDDRLRSQWHDADDFEHTWRWLVKRVLFRVDCMPLNLVQKDASNDKTVLIARKLSLSKKENRELNKEIVNVVERYIDDGNTQESAFRLASAKSKDHFKKWLSRLGINELTMRTIEGRYKRNRDKIED